MSSILCYDDINGVSLVSIPDGVDIPNKVKFDFCISNSKLEQLIKNQEIIKDDINKLKESIDRNYMKLKSKINDCKSENSKHLELHYTINKELIENVIKEDYNKKIESYKELNEVRVNMLIDKVEELTIFVENIEIPDKVNLLVEQNELVSGLVKDVLDIKSLDIKNIKLQLDTLKSLVYESLPGINLIE
jgi:hypothetical protein